MSQHLMCISLKVISKSPNKVLVHPKVRHKYWMDQSRPHTLDVLDTPTEGPLSHNCQLCFCPTGSFMCSLLPFHFPLPPVTFSILINE